MKKKTVDKVGIEKTLLSSMRNEKPADGRTYAVLSNERGVHLNQGSENHQKITKNHGSRPIAGLEDEQGRQQFVSAQVKKLTLKAAKLI
jgi:hypothetical protein